MEKKKKRSFKEWYKDAQNTSARDFIKTLNMEKFAAVVLVLMALLPLIANFSANIVVKAEDYRKYHKFLDLTNISTVGNIWFSMLLVIGFISFFATGYIILKLYYEKGTKSLLKKDFFKDNALPIFLILLLFWAILSAALSVDKKEAFFGNSYMRDGILSYFIYGSLFCTALLPNKKQVRIFTETLVGVCAFTGVLILTQGTKFNLLFAFMDDLRSSIFHQYNHYGYFLGICSPLAVGLALNDKSKNIFFRILRLGELWLIFNAVLFSSVRGSFVAIVAVMVLWNIIIIGFRREKILTLLVIDGLFAATVLFLNTGTTMLDRMGELFNQMTNAATSTTDAEKESYSDQMGSGRGVLWRYGIKFIKEKPLFGYGPENLEREYISRGVTNGGRPHNEFIQIAACSGVPALAFYLSGLAAHLVSFFKCFKKLSMLDLALFSAVACYLVGAVFGNTIYYTTPYFYIILGLTFKACKNIMRSEN